MKGKTFLLLFFVFYLYLPVLALTSCPRCGYRIGIDTEKSFNNSTAYIQSWLEVLRNDKKFIVSAAGKAEKAVKYIFNETENNDNSEE